MTVLIRVGTESDVPPAWVQSGRVDLVVFCMLLHCYMEHAFLSRKQLKFWLVLEFLLTGWEHQRTSGWV